MGTRRLLARALLSLALCSVTETSLAAKGVIKNAGSMGGSIYVTSLEGAIADTSSGNTISFAEDVTVPARGLREGSVVTFDILPGPTERAVNIQPLTKGTVLTVDMSARINVGPDQAVTITSGAAVHGDISVNGGALLLLDGSSFEGNVRLGTNAVFIAEGATLGGGRRVERGATGAVIKIADSTVVGSVQVSNGSRVVVTSSSVKGRIQSAGSAVLIVSGCTINGKVESTGDGAVTIINNNIQGNLKVSGVTGSCHTTNNTVTGKITTPGCSN